VRWTAWLVALCVLAAGVVRPVTLRVTDRHDSTIEDGSDVAASLAPRRSSQISTDKRSDRQLEGFTLAPAPAPLSPVRAVVVAAVQPRARTVARRAFARSSRGPPRAAYRVVDHPIS
jgi:hypothetical protein